MHLPNLAHRFDRLGQDFFSRVQPTPLPSPYIVAWNPALAAELGLDGGAGEWLAPLVGNETLPDYPPLAALYSGHQFGVYVQQLGDGRAITIAELGTPAGIQEIQLKGAGPTPYSRFGDGRAVLRSSIREYLCSEAMHGLGIPTTRALAIMGSDAPVRRETFETAAVVTRVAPSFVRFGSFEVFFYRDRAEELKRLADYVIEHFYPDCRHADNPYQALLEEVIDRTAALMARWQAVGFCHGVMNTDNMSILGLTLDYGPFGFLDGYDPHHICNHSDTQGRYAYDQQPHIALWNLYCLAQALIPLLDKDQATAALEAYGAQFEAYMADQFRQKLGLLEWRERDWELAGRLSQLMEPARTDWTIFWRMLGRFDSAEAADNAALRDLIADREGFDRWAQDYARRLREQNDDDAERRRRMDRANPKYVLRNHLAETAIREARDEGDYAEIERLRRCLSKPYDEQPEFEDYAAPPPDWASALSVSCSS